MSDEKVNIEVNVAMNRGLAIVSVSEMRWEFVLGLVDAPCCDETYPAR